MIRPAMMFFLACGGLFGLAESADAQITSPYGAGSWFGSPYSFYQRESIPYYSLHPPVYYSRPVARTYGYSPFAYPPGLMTPDAPTQPQAVPNPHVPKPSGWNPGSHPAQGEKTAATAPLIIVNPYVTAPQLSAAEPGPSDR